MIRLVAALLATVLAVAPATAADPVPPTASPDQMGPEAQAGGKLAAILLRAVPIFAGLSDATIATLAEQAEVRLTPKDRAVVREGDTTDSLFLLAAGNFIASRQDTVLDPLGPGEIIGEYALLTGAPRTATVKAVEDGLVFELPRAAMQPVMREYPQLITAMAMLMAERLQRKNPQGPSAEDIAKDLEKTARARLGL